MNTGFNSTITIKEITEATSSGDITPSLSSGDTVKCHIKQIDGRRYVSLEELVDLETYEIKCFDNSYTNNIVITYGSLTLRPIRIFRESGRSCTNELKIIAVVKR
jgi:hypothetical protein